MAVLREGLITGAMNLFFIYKFLRILTVPWKEFDAFKLGIVDEDGKILKKKRDLKTTDEKDAYTMMHRLVWKIKRLMEKVPFGKTRLASYAAALWLIKEGHSFKGDEQHLQESMLDFIENEDWNDEALLLKEEHDKYMNKKSFSKFLGERALTSSEKEKKEKIVKKLKSKVDDFESRYGDRAKSVMYGVATKQAKEELEIDEISIRKSLVRGAKKSTEVGRTNRSGMNLSRVWDKLGDLEGKIIKIEWSTDTKSSKGKEEFKVGKVAQGKGQWELPLTNVKKPKGIKYFFYNKNDDVSFAVGDTPAEVTSISGTNPMPESVEVDEEVFNWYIVKGTTKKGKVSHVGTERQLKLKIRKPIFPTGHVLMKSRKDLKIGDVWKGTYIPESNEAFYDKANLGQVNMYLDHLSRLLSKADIISHIKKKFNLKKVTLNPMSTKVLAIEANYMKDTDGIDDTIGDKNKQYPDGEEIEHDCEVVHPDMEHDEWEGLADDEEPTEENLDPELDEFKQTMQQKLKRKKWLRTSGGRRSVRKKKKYTAKIKSGSKRVNKALSRQMKKTRRKPGYRRDDLQVEETMKTPSFTEYIKEGRAKLSPQDEFDRLGVQVGDRQKAALVGAQQKAYTLRDIETLCRKHKVHLNPVEPPVGGTKDWDYEWQIAIRGGINLSYMPKSNTFEIRGWKVDKKKLKAYKDKYEPMHTRMQDVMPMGGRMMGRGFETALELIGEQGEYGFVSWMSKEQIIEAKFSPKMVDKLKKQYEPWRGKRISLAKNVELEKIVRQLAKDKEALIQLVKADIPFITMNARLILNKDHGVPLNATHEGVELDEIAPWKKGNYTVKDQDGKVLGRFKSGQKAQKFVDKIWDEGDYDSLTVELGEEVVYTYGLDEAKKPKNDVGMECQECGNKFRTKLSSLQYGKTKCPKCKSTDLDFGYNESIEAEASTYRDKARDDEKKKKRHFAFGGKKDKTRHGAGGYGKGSEEVEEGVSLQVKMALSDVGLKGTWKDNKVFVKKKDVKKAEKALKGNVIYKGKPPTVVGEDAPANNVGDGNIDLTPHKKKKKIETEEFSGSKVFIVSPDKFWQARLGKSRYTRYEKYVGNDDIGEAIREYGRANPKHPIILKNSQNGSMLYLKYGKRG